MKKWIFISCILGWMLCSIAASEPIDCLETSGYRYNSHRDCINHGDVILDGIITPADAQRCFMIALGQITPTAEEECAADCNGDGVVTAGDA